MRVFQIVDLVSLESFVFLLSFSWTIVICVGLIVTYSADVGRPF